MDHIAPQNMTTALALAAQGFAVFPVHAGGPKVKQPVEPFGWKKISTTDATAIDKLWRRNPSAGIAIDLAKAGLIVIDADRHGQHDGVAAFGQLMADHGHDPDSGPIVATPNAGCHFYFRQWPNEALGNARGDLPAGIDVRGSGGYVVAPGTVLEDGRAYELHGDLSAIPTLPAWLRAILTRAKSEPRPQPVQRQEHSDARIRAYVDAAVEAETARVRMAGEGNRNHSLNQAAFALGQLVGAGWIQAGEVEGLLTGAAHEAGLKQPEIRKTIRSGITAGQREPRQLADAYENPEHAEAARRLVENFTKKEINKAASELEWFDDIAPVINTPYLVKGVIDRGAMSVVYGASNSGKTFFALDLAFHIAIGQQWRDRRVSLASVLYLAAEGGNGIANRIVALRGEYGVCDVPLALRRAGLDLLKNAADTANVVALAREVSKRGDIGLIVIDTLSRVIAGGDENAATDMTAFIRNVDMIRQQTGAHIMVVHHTGKDAAKGARGHSSLRAATDTEIEISLDEAGNRFANTTKQRDHTGGESWCFKLKPIQLGQDADGDLVSTCVVESILPQEQPKDALPPRDKCQKILDDIRAAWEAKNPYSMSAQSQRTGRYAPRALSKRHNVKDAVTYRLLLAWLDNDVIRSEQADARNKRSGLKVIGSI